MNKSIGEGSKIPFGFLKQGDKEYPIEKQRTFIGKDPTNCDVCLLSAPSVGLLHAQIEVLCPTTKDQSYQALCLLRDLHSTHGTWVNNIKLESDVPILIRNGDCVKIGLEEFKIVLNGKDDEFNLLLNTSEVTIPLEEDVEDIKDDFRNVTVEANDVEEYLEEKDFPNSSTPSEDDINDLIDETIAQKDGTKKAFVKDVVTLARNLSSKLDSLELLFPSITPFDKNQMPFNMLMALDKLQKRLSQFTKDTIFERKRDIKHRELYHYANSIERNMLHYKKRVREFEQQIDSQLQKNKVSQQEQEKISHQLTSQLHSALDEIQILKKKHNRDKELNQSFSKEIDRMKCKLGLLEAHNYEVRKSNKTLREQLLKTQEYSNMLHKELVREKASLLQPFQQSSSVRINSSTPVAINQETET